MNKPLTIFLVSFDWTDLAGRDPKDFISRLERDKLHPDTNHFVIWSWGKGNYERDLSSTVRVIRRSARFPALRPLYDLLSFILIPRYLAATHFKFDLVFVYDFPLAFALFRAARRIKVPLVLGLTNMPRAYISARNSLSWPKILYQKCTERLGVSRLSGVYTINEATSKYAQELGVPANRIVIFSSDVILRDKALIEQADPHYLRTKFPIPAEHKILLCVARLDGEKGGEVLLDAFARLADKNLTLVLAGKGPLESVLRVRAQRLGIQGRVIFAGHLSRPDMWSAYKGADAFILLSKAEALGLVFWEAMYVGLPVIGSRASGIKETIGAGEERGYLWEPADRIPALEKRVTACVSRDKQTGVRIRRARAYVEEKLTDVTDIHTLVAQL